MANLDGPALERLNRAGYLEGAYLVLSSMLNVRRLMAEKQRRLRAQDADAPQSLFAQDPEIKREVIWGGPFLRQGNTLVDRRGALVRVRDRIANGTSISDAFAMENLFPSLVVRMLRVGEATGALDEALSNVSYFYTRDIDESIGRVQALIEPVLTVVLGLILGWIMLAVLGPIYDTISKIRT